MLVATEAIILDQPEPLQLPDQVPYFLALHPQAAVMVGHIDREVGLRMEVMAVRVAAGQIMVVLVAQETHHQPVHHKAVTVELRLMLNRIMEPVAVVVLLLLEQMDQLR